MHRSVLAAVLAAFALGAAPLPAAADDVLVFAAASLKESLDAVAADFEAKTGDHVTISYAGSGALARQIVEGAEADVFISAAVEWMDAVDDAGLVADDSRRDLLGNTLVLIAPGKDAEPVTIDPQLDLVSRLGDSYLAMALVDSVPAGQYGKAALESLGLWDAVAPHVAQADNVRAALALVARGEAPLGIVYATDAAAGDEVSIVGTFPEDSHPPIIYPAALLGTGEKASARAFYDTLSSPEAAQRFEAAGFRMLP